MRLRKNTVWIMLQLLFPFFVLIAAVALLRELAYVLDSPHWLVVVTSVSVAMTLSILLAVVILHAHGRDSYLNVFLASFLLVGWSQGLIALGILITIRTGRHTVYSIPEYTMSDDPRMMVHLLGHLIVIPLLTLLGGATGSVVLWLLRRGARR